MFTLDVIFAISTIPSFFVINTIFIINLYIGALPNLLFVTLVLMNAMIYMGTIY